MNKLSDTSGNIRPLEFYVEKGKPTLEINARMVIFCDSDTRPFLDKIRGDRNTYYVEKNITEYDYFAELHPVITANRQKIPTFDKRNTASIFLLYMFKFKALSIAKSLNIWSNTTHYLWVDIGASHVVRNFNYIYDIIQNPRPKCAFCYIHYRSKAELYPVTKYLNGGAPCGIAATVFSIEDAYLDRVFTTMFAEMYYQISEGVGHTDESCIVYVYDKHPEWFSLYYGDYQSAIENYHYSVNDYSTIQRFFITNALKDNRDDIAKKAIESMSTPPLRINNH
jgi:hypothetical protein